MKNIIKTFARIVLVPSFTSIFAKEEIDLHGNF